MATLNPSLTEQTEKKTRKKRTTRGTVNRSEIVQTRLSPRLRFTAELIARHQRRTLSSVIEDMVEEAAERYALPLVLSEKAQTDSYLFSKYKFKKVPATEAGERLWSSEEADRFAALALFTPHLLTPQECQVWRLVIDTHYFWNHFEINIETKKGEVIGNEWWPLVDYNGLIRERLREHWPLLREILEERETPEAFKKLNLPGGRLVERPDYYPYPIKKIDPSVVLG